MTHQLNFIYNDSDWIAPSEYPDLSQAKEIRDATLKDLITIEKAFKSIDSIKISKDDTKKFINGVEFKYQESQRDCVKVYNDDNEFLGLGEVNKNFLKHKQLV